MQPKYQLTDPYAGATRYFDDTVKPRYVTPEERAPVTAAALKGIKAVEESASLPALAAKYAYEQLPVEQRAMLETAGRMAGNMGQRIAQSVPVQAAGEVLGRVYPNAGKLTDYIGGSPADNPLFNLETGPGGLEALMAWHGSPHKMTEWGKAKNMVGTGEGFQSQGYGLYLGENKNTGEYYASLGLTKGNHQPFSNVIDRMGWDAKNPAEKAAASALADTQPVDEFLSQTLSPYRFDWSNAYDAILKRRTFADLPKEVKEQALNKILDFKVKTGGDLGYRYRVDIPDEMIPKMYDLDAIIDEQHPEVMQKLNATDWYPKVEEVLNDQSIASNPTGRDLLRYMEEDYDPEVVSEMFRQAGIPGHKFLDMHSRVKGKGTSNFVIFPGEEQNVKILSRNSQPIEQTLLNSEKTQKALKPAEEIHTLKNDIAKAAQEEYNSWAPNAEGVDVECGEGGICDSIASRIGEILSKKGYDIVDGGWEGSDHAYVIAHKGKDAFIVDIPPQVYETGAGYNWIKKEGVQITPNHVVIEPININDVLGPEGYAKGGSVKDFKDFAKDWYERRQWRGLGLGSAYGRDEMEKRLDSEVPYEKMKVIDNNPGIKAQYVPGALSDKIQITPNVKPEEVAHEWNHLARKYALGAKLNDYAVAHLPGTVKSSEDYLFDASDKKLHHKLGSFNSAMGMYDEISDPEEIQTRLMRMRYAAGFQPDKDVTKEDLQNFYKNYNGKDFQINQLLDIAPNDDAMLRLLNLMSNNQKPSDDTVYAAEGGPVNTDDDDYGQPFGDEIAKLYQGGLYRKGGEVHKYIVTSLTPVQKRLLKAHHAELGDESSFDDWMSDAGIPAIIHGHATKSMDSFLTPEQREMLDQVNS